MSRRNVSIVGALLILPLLAAVPLVVSGYHLALGISLLSYAVLAISWGMFSGPTRYISLATSAFFGIGAYVGAALGESMPWPLVLLFSGLVGACMALIVGASTLRLSGIYFVIFTFGLSELVRQIVTWYEVTVTKSVGRYLFLNVTQSEIYWQLLALLGVTIAVGSAIGWSRYGLALRLIGDDEVAARHSGVDTTRVKLVVFVIGSVLMTFTGTIMAPRWTYIDPAIAFNPSLSFLVVIMALLGGTGHLLAPVLGVVPLVILFDILTATVPNYFSIVLGLIFIGIVYVMPNGLWHLAAQLFKPNTRDAVSRGLTSGTDVSHPIVEPSRSRETKVEPEVLLEVEGLSRRFGGLTAVDNLNLTLMKGEILGLIGPNGSGKTTALNLISGSLAASAGIVMFEKRVVNQMSTYLVARGGIARTFQLVRVFRSMTCVENVQVGLQFRESPASALACSEAEGLLRRVGLGGKGGTRADELTYIDQKRLELARALALRPRLILLDEWLAGLNPTELRIGINLIRSIRDDGITIIMVEHVMDAVRSLCDRCVVINVGRKIADGPPNTVLKDPDVIRAYLGEERA